MKKYKHLENVEKVDFDWQNNLFKKSLPSRAWVNVLTKNMMLSMELIISLGARQIEKIKKYKQI